MYPIIFQYANEYKGCRGQVVQGVQGSRSVGVQYMQMCRGSSGTGCRGLRGAEGQVVQGM